MDLPARADFFERVEEWFNSFACKANAHGYRKFESCPSHHVLLGSSVAEHPPVKRRVAGSIPALAASLSGREPQALGMISMR